MLVKILVGVETVVSTLSGKTVGIKLKLLTMGVMASMILF
jgi:hypothetical protein